MTISNFIASLFFCCLGVSLVLPTTAFVPENFQVFLNKKYDDTIGIDIPASPRESNPVSRSDFLHRTLLLITATTFPTTQPAFARGRATLEQAYDRYTPRIIAGGKFYAQDLRDLIAKNDWAGIKAATSDPPKKQKSDLAKIDGGIAERAAKAGGFSDARVLVACELYGGSFSDNSITAKTKSLKTQVENLRKVVEEMNLIAREALGEVKEGGFLGIVGSKSPSPGELSKTIRQLYAEGGNYWNQYIFAANDGLPPQLAKLPYL